MGRLASGPRAQCLRARRRRTTTARSGLYVY